MLLAESAVFVASLLAASVVAPYAIRGLRRAGVIDHPSQRSSHDRPTVRGAGVLCLAGVLVGLSVASWVAPTASGVFAALAIAATVATVLGFAEDRHGLPIVVRAGSQLLIGLGVAFTVGIQSGAAVWIILLGALFVAGYTNVANFMDGVDTMSVSHALVVGALWTLAGAFGLAPGWLTLSGTALAGAFLAFLPWNMRQHKAFLGDAGSYLLGTIIASTATAAILSGAPPLAVLAPLTIYLADTGSTFVSRIARGERWYESHRTHVYHRLEDLGFSHIRTAATVASFSAAAGVFGLLASIGPVVVTLGSIGGLVLTVLIYIELPRILRARQLNRADRHAG